MENDLQIFRQPDKAAATAEAGEYLNRLLASHIKSPILLMLSGGSALSLLDFVGQTSLGENLSISMLDERFSQDPQVNNFAQMQKKDFYQDALNSDCSFFGTLPRNGETMTDLAARWEYNLRTWRQENPKGVVIATLGMGSEGHTAGIFPNDDAKKFEELFNKTSWVAAYDVGAMSPYPNRITTTIPFLKTIDFALAFVSGAEKKEKFDQVEKKQGQINNTPALVWHQLRETKVFTDLI